MRSVASEGFRERNGCINWLWGSGWRREQNRLEHLVLAKLTCISVIGLSLQHGLYGKWEGR
jgi:hypothetical protein